MRKQLFYIGKLLQIFVGSYYTYKISGTSNFIYKFVKLFDWKKGIGICLSLIYCNVVYKSYFDLQHNCTRKRSNFHHVKIPRLIHLKSFYLFIPSPFYRVLHKYNKTKKNIKRDLRGAWIMTTKPNRRLWRTNFPWKQSNMLPF